METTRKEMGMRVLGLLLTLAVIAGSYYAGIGGLLKYNLGYTIIVAYTSFLGGMAGALAVILRRSRYFDHTENLFWAISSSIMQIVSAAGFGFVTAHWRFQLDLAIGLVFWATPIILIELLCHTVWRDTFTSRAVKIREQQEHEHAAPQESRE